MLQMSEMTKSEELKDRNDIYLFGVKVDSKEHYDKLMDNHSGFLMGIDFKGLFQEYPTEYPTLICYEIDQKLLNYMIMFGETKKIIEDGYLVQICREADF